MCIRDRNNIERKLKKLICDYNLDYNIKAIYNEAEEEAAYKFLELSFYVI